MVSTLVKSSWNAFFKRFAFKLRHRFGLIDFKSGLNSNYYQRSVEDISMTSLKSFQTRLQNLLKMDVELVVNENRSTMLNLLKKERSFARLSLHKMFLEAPDPVISAIAHYVKGTRKELGKRNLVLREFIQSHLANYDYTHLVNPQKLVQQGKCYHLTPLYEALNKKYFEGKLALSLTWFGASQGRRRRRITFGQYFSGLRLIKMHRMLDDPFVPEYFVSFILYHEMLHSVVPGSKDARGRFCVHGKAFKEKERVFEDYQKAIEWEKNNKAKVFGFNYGRS